MVGFKKCFFPANRKAKEIISSPEFGGARNLYVRYPQSIPSQEHRNDPARMIGFLDHIAHPGAILHYLMGPVDEMAYFRESRSGGLTASLRFASGAVGTLHLVAGQSGTSPLERVEVIGGGANVVVENGAKLTYYRKGGRGEGGYGRSADFIGPDEGAPIVWEPEFSLGQLYNSGLFLLGYAPEILDFCRCALENRPPAVANLNDAMEVMRLYEAFRSPEGQVIRVGEFGPPRSSSVSGA
jgi:predicted dehydrogenase